MALNDPTAAAIATAVRDTAMEGALTFQHMLRIILSGIAGIASGGGTSSITFRDQADSKNRITETVDALGNRSAVTVDGT